MENIKKKYTVLYNEENNFIGHYIENGKLYIYADYYQYFSIFFVDIKDIIAITTKGHSQSVYFILKNKEKELSISTPSLGFSKELINKINIEIENLKNKKLNNKMIKEV